MLDRGQALTRSFFVVVCLCTDFRLCTVRFERWSQQDGSRGKNKPPRQPVCLSDDDVLHTFLLCAQLPGRLVPLLHFHLLIAFILSLPLTLLLVLMALPSSCTSFFWGGKRPCLFQDKRMKGSNTNSSPYWFPSLPLSAPLVAWE